MTKLLRKLPQHGNLMIGAAILIVVISFLATIIASILTTDSYGTLNQAKQLASFYLAQAGLERGKYALFSPDINARVACAALTNTSSLQDVVFDSGVFSVSGTLYAPTAVTLSSAITNSSSVIPLSSITGFAPQGRVLIEKEGIDYIGTSSSAATCGIAPCLTNVHRGAAGTTAMSHPQGVSVGQYQCNITAQGGVPVLSPSSSVAAKSIIQENDTLTYGFLAGKAQGGARLYAWNPSSSAYTWVQFSVGGGGLNADYNAITATNYNRAWAASSSGNIAYYDGNSWTLQFNTSDTFNAIDCVTDNTCWVAANKGNIYRYNGSTWSKFTQVDNSVTLTALTCFIDNTVSTPPNPPYRCLAAGYQDNVTGGVVYDYTSARNTWNLVASFAFDVYGLSCSAANNCWVVGGITKTKSNVAFYNGSTWAVVTPPVVDAQMYTVHCLSQNYCWAAGGKDYVYFYNGSTWSDPISIGDNSSINNIIHTIRCISSTNCWAGGNRSGDLYHYDGVSWTLYQSLGMSIYGIYFPLQMTNTYSSWSRL